MPYGKASVDSRTGLKRLLEQKRRQVGCLILFFAIIFALMADRGVFFGILNEVSDSSQLVIKSMFRPPDGAKYQL